ncbi:hypothetical protein DN820_08445 [Stutzerimonas nosocomialis]|uniref:Uracil-DNA glycosylase-like domain-containing protein n=1 Tax=Stutzerimonas nosocomialis TaxID=1056496 RepID=A0A5R9QG58_9GAMM|nr:hypothetical protein [Stutzerimonas nosocomialis]TLX64030.1 hypothetical protein DN820_08445 [Stutzerimonas nosocomialis]
MNLEKFEAELKDLVGKPFHDRPFVCDGSPLDCQVFIVGINAASKMKEDFWDFWRPGYGFDKQAWYRAYLNSRTKTSRTRTAMQIVMDEAISMNGNARFIETNIYSIPTARERMLKREQMSTQVFDFLLETIKPKILLVHGAKPNRYLQKNGYGNSRVIETPHFVRISHEFARARGREIAQALAGA